MNEKRKNKSGENNKAIGEFISLYNFIDKNLNILKNLSNKINEDIESVDLVLNPNTNINYKINELNNSYKDFLENKETQEINKLLKENDIDLMDP